MCKASRAQFRAARSTEVIGSKCSLQCVCSRLYTLANTHRESLRQHKWPEHTTRQQSDLTVRSFEKDQANTVTLQQDTNGNSSSIRLTLRNYCGTCESSQGVSERSLQTSEVSSIQENNNKVHMNMRQQTFHFIVTKHKLLMVDYHNLSPKVVVELLTFLICIRHVSVSNLVMETGYPD
jgi:hypothetical protein